MAQEKFEDHLIRQGYTKAQQRDIVTGREYWERLSRYATPPCRVNGKQRVRVYVERRKDEQPPIRFEMEIVGNNGRFWSTITSAIETEELLIKSSGEIEHRLSDAWREMS